MELLFKREQTLGRFNRVNFRLWGKVEVSADEQALIDRYRFDETVLIGADDFQLIRRAALIGFGMFLLVGTITAIEKGPAMGIVAGLVVGIAAGYVYMNEKRETIFVKDMLHGRHFTCDSVVELARKEAWLEGACGVFRQVMESAKHWDGIERHTIEPLPKEQAKELILRAA